LNNIYKEDKNKERARATPFSGWYSPFQNKKEELLPKESEIRLHSYVEERGKTRPGTSKSVRSKARRKEYCEDFGLEDFRLILRFLSSIFKEIERRRRS